jgi:SET domain-containing protein
MPKNPYPVEIYRTKSEIRAFFRRQGVRYLKRTRVAWKPLLSMNLRKSPYYRENRSLFEGLCRRYGERIESGFLAPLYIRKISEAVGYGVFAGKALSEGDFIGEYAGVVQPETAGTGVEESEGGYESDYSWYYLDELPSGPTLEINGRWEGNILRYVNHGLSPNVSVEHTLCGGQWLIFFTAARDIGEDEQLLIDYGEAYWGDGYREETSL